MAAAVFANPRPVFTPGMFARVQVPASAPYEALLVPDVAIGTEQARKFVLVVGADNIAAPKYVTLGQRARTAQRVIKEGIDADDRVDRQRPDARARPGQKVTPQEQARRPPPRLARRRPRRSEAE